MLICSLFSRVKHVNEKISNSSFYVKLYVDMGLDRGGGLKLLDIFYNEDYTYLNPSHVQKLQFVHFFFDLIVQVFFQIQ